MFHPEIGYAEAQRRGAVQSAILAELIRGKVNADQVDLALAERLIAERLLL